jgi:predicted nucleotidyltransferase component of viral defense system
LDFKPKLEDKKFLEFGGGGRMATFKLWKRSELVKIQVNFVEKILFKPKVVGVKTLLDKTELKEDEKVYFEEFLEFYKPFEIVAYDEREILCEKVRAILTRKAQKLRDFYDLFVLQNHGFRDLVNEIVEKTRTSLYYKKYSDVLKRNKERLEIGREILEDPFERRLFVEKPQKEFDIFLEAFIGSLRRIVDLLP